MRLVGPTGLDEYPNALAAAVAADRAEGRVPVMIVATAGTTGSGMIDPLAAMRLSPVNRGFGITSMPPGAVR